MNTYTHVGFVHFGTYCTRCNMVCFDSCSTTEDTSSPTSSGSPPIIKTSFHSFLGDFHPRTAVERELDYTVRVSDKGVEGLWICTVCRCTNRDFGMAHFHVKHDHSQVRCRFCNLCCNSFLTLDAHMQEAHPEQMPVQCQICSIWLPDATSLMPHFKWHGDPYRRLIPHRYATNARIVIHSWHMGKRAANTELSASRNRTLPWEITVRRLQHQGLTQ